MSVRMVGKNGSNVLVPWKSSVADFAGTHAPVAVTDVCAHWVGADAETLPVILTQEGGAQLFWDVAESPGAVDGSPISGLTNLSGSNAVFDSVNNWGHGAVPLPNYMATGWGKRSPAIFTDSGQGFRFTGSDIGGCINGVGKAWHYSIVFEPVLLSGTLLEVGGFTASLGAAFASGMTLWLTGWGTPGTFPGFLLEGQGGVNVPDTQRVKNGPQILEVWRPDATHVQISLNGVDSPPIAYGSGTNFAGIDGITYGAWNNTVNNGLGNTQARYVMGTAHNIIPNRVALRAALKKRVSGFDYQASLGAI